MKHAYLIMCHTDFYILEKLLILLDFEMNDIYIHVDKKVKDFNFDYYRKLLKKSNLYYVKQTDVRWGTYKQIECELLLFEEAHKKKYQYYHLLSGIDLPLKPQKEIHDFFEKHKGMEFIAFDNHNKVKKYAHERILYRHYFVNQLRGKNKIISRFFNSLHSRLLLLQKKLKIKRKIPFQVRKGANWISITDELVNYILENKKIIKKYFSKSYCADEVFVQTLVYNSSFYRNVYSKKDDDYLGIKRYIDWKRGNPYTFTEEDFDLLINSKCFFARKFSTETDKVVIDKIFQHVRNDVNE